LPKHFQTPVLFIYFSFFFSINDFSSVLSQNIVIDSIYLKGNETTKRNIILRELMFHEGDTIPLAGFEEKIVKSRENLLNTSLFNFVTIDTIREDFSHFIVHITVIERWYIWPFPIFELADRNFNVWWETKDFSRTNYGVYIVKENFRGRRETLKFKFQMGYNEEIAFSYNIPYVNKKQTLGLGLISSYGRNHETNYATSGNKQLFYKDEKNYTRERHSEGIRLTYRKNLRSLHSFEARYNFASVSDTIIKLNSDYLLSGNTKLNYFSTFYHYEYDERNSKYYPIQGYYFSFDAMKNGFGMFGYKNINADFIMLTIKYFSKLNSRWYYAASAKVKASEPGKPPYILQRGLGYSDFVRGYDYYVVDGQYFGLVKSEIRFVLLPTKITKIPFVKTEKFNKIHYTIYLNAYVDGGYVWDKYYYQGNALNNIFLLGGGISLNYVTYYDKVLGIDYSVNKLGEFGFFLHYLAPI
jgi:outer membrane protein assembly factor BamA